MSQFTDEDGNPGLGSLFELPKDVYPVGRLDLDSEGLLILTNDRKLNHKLLDPKFTHWRKYWVQVEGAPDTNAITQLETGIEINLKGKKHHTRPAKVKPIEPTGIIEREPPVNYKKHSSTTWWEISLCEGKNRQVRRMFAGVGHPVLRLIRVAMKTSLYFRYEVVRSVRYHLRFCIENFLVPRVQIDCKQPLNQKNHCLGLGSGL